MGHWQWVVPVMLGIWFLIQLIRKTDEERRSRERAANSDRPPLRPRRPPAGDIDRFLEEVNRRRRQATERRPGTTEEVRPVVATPVTRPGPGARPRPAPRLQPTRQSPPRGAVPQPPLAEVVVAVPVAVPATGLQRLAPAPTAPPPPEPPLVPGTATKVSPPADPVVLLKTLLQSPQNLRAAILLRVILDPPLCRRRR
jgi:hypothetical protein